MSSQDFYQPPQGPPPSHGQNQSYNQQQTPSYGGPPQSQGYAPQQQYQQGPPTTQSAPGLPARRTADDAALPQGQDRAEQLEYMQSYEASAPRSVEDEDQAVLAREFPSVDSSLIAALYSDSKSLGATREMLQELTREG